MPAKVESVLMADETTLALCLRSAARTGWLHISWHPVAARVCVGEQPERGEAAEAYPFGALVNSKCALHHASTPTCACAVRLRCSLFNQDCKLTGLSILCEVNNLTPRCDARCAAGVEFAAWCCRLRGQVLTGVSMPVPFDRVVQLDFAVRVNDAPALRLFCEAQGRFSNAVLADGARTVLLAGRQIGAAQTAARSVRVGEAYALPPVAPGVTPSLGEGRAVWQSNVAGATALDDGKAAAVAAALSRAYQGVSPPLAAELCAIAGVDARGSAAKLSQSEWADLHAAWTRWLERLRDGDFAPCRAATGGGGVSMLGTRPQAHDSVHACVDSHYREAQARERFAALRATLRRATAKAEGSLQSKLRAFEKQLGSVEDAEDTQKEADLIMANVYRWQSGSDSLEAEDWDTGLTPCRDASLPAALWGTCEALLTHADRDGPLWQCIHYAKLIACV